MYNAPKRRKAKCAYYNVFVRLKDKANKMYELSDTWKVVGSHDLLDTEDVSNSYRKQGFVSVQIVSICEVSPKSWNSK